MNQRLFPWLCLTAALMFPPSVCGQRTSDDALSQLSRFAAADSDSILVLRQSLFTRNSALHRRMMDNLRDNLSVVPFEVSDIEQVVILGPNPGRAAQARFASVAADLGSGGEPSELAAPMDKPVGYVRMTKKVNTSDLQAAVKAFEASRPRLEPAAELDYQVEKYRGQEFLRSDVEGAPAVMRIDDRTFVVGELHQLKRGLDRDTPTRDWLSAFGPRAFQGDFVLAIRTEGWVGNAPSRLGPLQVLTQSESILFRVNLSQATLASADVFFGDTETAQGFRSRIEGMHTMARTQVEASVEQMMSQATGEERALAAQLGPIYGSLRFSQEGPRVSITLPRPDQFETLIEQFVKVDQQRRARAEARFGALSRELDAGPPAPTYRIRAEEHLGSTLEAEDGVTLRLERAQ